MNCALRTCVYAFVTGFLLYPHGFAAIARGGKDSKIGSASCNSSSSAEEFNWSENRRLSWEDFKGPVKAVSEESAAATNCGIGFKTVGGKNGKPEVVVYNTFYTNRSWVRSDAKIPEILVHEQGHFDLCEIYTRKLRQRMTNFNFDVADVRSALMNIYEQLQNEYELRQQAYETETTHGTNIPVQKKWQQRISQELAVNELALNN